MELKNQNATDVNRVRKIEHLNIEFYFQEIKYTSLSQLNGVCISAAEVSKLFQEEIEVYCDFLHIGNISFPYAVNICFGTETHSDLYVTYLFFSYDDAKEHYEYLRKEYKENEQCFFYEYLPGMIIQEREKKFNHDYYCSIDFLSYVYKEGYE